MAFKPNYRQQRNDRSRAKEAKKEKKLLKQQERVAQRKGEVPGTGTGTEPPAVAKPDEVPNG